MSTEIHRDIIARAEEDPDLYGLSAEVWAPTPWIIDVYEGHWELMLHHEMACWCRDRWGQESSPINGHEGTWHRGEAAVSGWTWWGFATEEMMEEFVAEWCAYIPAE